ncbi:MAG: hypothetical protein WCJ64_23300, partial [Rhodospirillaceae bacterium]
SLSLPYDTFLFRSCARPKAYGYVLVRAEETAAGREAVAKVASLDPGDRVGASRLLAVIDRGGVEDEDA